LTVGRHDHGVGISWNESTVCNGSNISSISSVHESSAGGWKGQVVEASIEEGEGIEISAVVKLLSIDDVCWVLCDERESEDVVVGVSIRASA